eukprot:scaffold6591_cov106-Cylindrotheca_fusiformis.AAC.4
MCWLCLLARAGKRWRTSCTVSSYTLRYTTSVGGLNFENEKSLSMDAMWFLVDRDSDPDLWNAVRAAAGCIDPQ